MSLPQPPSSTHTRSTPSGSRVLQEWVHFSCLAAEETLSILDLVCSIHPLPLYLSHYTIWCRYTFSCCRRVVLGAQSSVISNYSLTIGLWRFLRFPLCPKPVTNVLKKFSTKSCPYRSPSIRRDCCLLQLAHPLEYYPSTFLDAPRFSNARLGWRNLEFRSPFR